jgi:two-component system, OmpR family, response regulator
MTAAFIRLSGAIRETLCMRVLVVEDEARMASVISRSLTREGMATDVARDGEEAISMATVVDYDAIVLDVMLPRRSGFEACRVMRDRAVWSPVLMLTARDAVDDRVAGLDSGADDYLVKPFALAELHARLRSLVRRGRPERPTVLRVGDLSLDPARREVRRGDVPIDLSAKEFALLEALMRRPGEVLTRLELIEQAWDLAYETQSNVIDVYIGRLRRKLDEPFAADSLETVRGAGYRLRDDTR